MCIEITNTLWTHLIPSILSSYICNRNQVFPIAFIHDQFELFEAYRRPLLLSFPDAHLWGNPLFNNAEKLIMSQMAGNHMIFVWNIVLFVHFYCLFELFSFGFASKSTWIIARSNERRSPFLLRKALPKILEFRLLAASIFKISLKFWTHQGPWKSILPFLKNSIAKIIAKKIWKRSVKIILASYKLFLSLCCLNSTVKALLSFLERPVWAFLVSVFRWDWLRLILVILTVDAISKPRQSYPFVSWATFLGV